MLQLKPPTKGYERKWLQCSICSRVAYYDFIPYSLSRPIMVMPCNHRIDDAAQITHHEALSLLYPDLFGADKVMEATFARLADELEAQAAAELEKRETLLFHMLSHTTHFLERFLKRQEARGTPQSLEAADYVREELKTAQDWREELREAK